MLLHVLPSDPVGDTWKLKVVRSQSKIGDVWPLATALSKPASHISASISSRKDIDPASPQTVRIRTLARSSWLEVGLEGMGLSLARLR